MDYNIVFEGMGKLFGEEYVMDDITQIAKRVCVFH